MIRAVAFFCPQSVGRPALTTVRTDSNSPGRHVTHGRLLFEDGRLVRAGLVVGGSEDVYEGQGDGDDDGAEDEPEDAEDVEAAEHREEDEEFVEPCPLAD